tara:strand:- start:441 stop:905 length:465 start_codon:yes stop_codon:yes gene_type:complete
MTTSVPYLPSEMMEIIVSYKLAMEHRDKHKALTLALAPEIKVAAIHYWNSGERYDGDELEVDEDDRRSGIQRGHVINPGRYDDLGYFFDIYPGHPMSSRRGLSRRPCYECAMWKDCNGLYCHNDKWTHEIVDAAFTLASMRGQHFCYLDHLMRD